MTAISQEAQQQAIDTLYSEVYVPALFEKLASDYGIQPRTEDEARVLLTRAAQLRAIHESEKTAKSSVNHLDKAGAAIDKLLVQHGIAPAATNNLLKVASQQAALSRPDLAAAILTLEVAARQAA